MRRGRAGLAIAAAFVASTVTGATVGWTLLSGHGEPDPQPVGTAGASFLGRSDPAAVVDASLVLRVDVAAAEAYVSGGGGGLDAEAFGERFGLPTSEVDRVSTAISRAGLRVVEGYPQRTALRVRGTVAAFGALFSTTIGDFAEPDGERFRAPLFEPLVPDDLAGAVTGVSGLYTRRLIHSNAVVAAIPTGGLKPDDAAAAYNVTPLHEQGLLGQDQTIAIVSFDSFFPEDVDAYDARVGISGAPPVEQIPVGGGTEVGEASIEVNLDIDVIRGIAPQAQILDFEAPNDGTVGFGDIINAIVADGRADIISISWGMCDAPGYLGGDSRAADQQAFLAAAAAGINIFVASGDNGAYTCERFNLQDKQLSTSWPGDSPNVVSVGGTLLSVRADGTYLSEAGWEDILSNTGGGGGLNPLDPRPEWQTGPGVDNEHSNGLRQLPDVAAAGDPDSGWFIMYTPPGSGERVESSVGGTSASAPFWAASMLLVQQLALQEGAGPLGFLNPVLYRVAQSTPGAFHDVVRGGNRFHNATAGWDYATGLGSPDVAVLADAIIADLQG